MKLLFYISAYWLQIAISNAQIFATCVEKETCIALSECPQLATRVLEVSSKGYMELNYLRRKQCGYENRQVLVCCEVSTASRSTSNNLGGNKNGNSIVNSGSKGRGNLLPNPPECGPVLVNRVVGGTATHLYEFPWLAMLEYTTSSGSKSFLCGGSLINHRYVLTAAHCVIVEDLRLTGVRLAEWDVRTNPDCETIQSGVKDCSKINYLDLRIVETIVHDGYEKNSLSPHNDIALLRLSHEVEYNDLIRPICLPKSTLRNELFIGSKMDVAGWGLTETNQPANVKTKVELGVWSLNDCRNTYPNISLIDNQMCAGGKEKIDSCKGDSGGPLMAIVDNTYTLAGIVSFGPMVCGTKGLPGIYTRVAAFTDWIQEGLKP